MTRFLLILFFITCINSYASDLKMFSLNGKVDSVCVVTDDAGLTWQTEYKFDKNGFLIEFDGIIVDADRDEQNHITDFIVDVTEDENEPVTIETSIDYDANGLVIKTVNSSPDDDWTETFTYDKRGRLIQRVYTGVDTNEHFTYKYLKEDENGNWVERHEIAASNNQTLIQRREIFYSN